VILYRKTPPLRIRRTAAPEPPFWAATTIAPYTSRRATPVAIDYLDLRATGAERLEVAVCDNVTSELERAGELRDPVLIEASGDAETVFGRGEEALAFCRDHGYQAFVLRHMEGGGHAASLGTGVVVPVMFPVTTDLEWLEKIASQANEQGAKFLASVTIELDATAKQALATDDETYATLFHADLDPIHIATERHVAALAAEHGLADFVLPPRWEERSNWNAAIVLTLAASRMIAMEHEPELAGTLARSARLIAELDKPIERIAESANLAIIDKLDEASVDILTEWLETGRSVFVDRINAMWRLRRDYGVQDYGVQD
jgi:hypothetical protein